MKCENSSPDVKSPQFEFLNRLGQLPVVSSAIQYAAYTYELAKVKSLQNKK